MEKLTENCTYIALNISGDSEVAGNLIVLVTELPKSLTPKAQILIKIIYIKRHFCSSLADGLASKDIGMG